MSKKDFDNTYNPIYAAPSQELNPNIPNAEDLSPKELRHVIDIVNYFDLIDKESQKRILASVNKWFDKGE